MQFSIMAAPIKTPGIFCILLIVCLSHVRAFTDYDDDDVASDSIITVEHTFDSAFLPEFSKKGTIIIQSIKSGSADFTQERSPTEEDLDKLKQLVKNDDVYRVRISSKSADGRVSYVSSFVKACALYEAGLRDKITVHLDTSGNVIGVSITTPTPYCVGKEMNDEDLDKFVTSVDVVQTVAGPVPETQSYIEKIEREKAEKAQGQQPDNRSFFAKYWMYIVPVVIMMMFMNSQDPNAQGGGGGGGGGGN